MKKNLVIGLLLIFTLVACSTSAPSPSAQVQLPDDTATPSPVPSATSTPLPSLTPTITPTPSPTPSYFVRDGTPVPQPSEAISPENVSQIAELARWGYGTVQRVLFMADDEIMVVKTPIAVYAYAMGTVDELWRLELPNGFSAVAASTNKDELALGTYDGLVLRLDARSGQELARWQAHSDEVLGLDYSSDDKMLASSSQDRSVRIWEIEKGSLFNELVYREEAVELFFANNDEHLAIRIWNLNYGYVYVFLDIVTMSKVSENIRKDDVETLSTDLGMYVYFGKAGFRLKDFQGNIIAEFDLPEELITGFGPLSSDLSQDGKLLVIGVVAAIFVFDAQDGTLLSKFETGSLATIPSNAHAKPAKRSGPGPYGVFSVDISHDNRMLVASDGYGDTYLWDLEAQQLIRKAENFGKGNFFLPNDQAIMSASGSSFDIYSVPELRPVSFIPGGWGRELAFSPGGTRLAYGSLIWQMDNGQSQSLPKKEDFIGFSPNGNYVFTIAEEWWVRQRRTVDLELQQQTTFKIPELEEEYWDDYLSGQWYELEGWTISPDGTLIHATAWELPVLSWYVEDGEYAGATGGDPYSIFTYAPNNQYFINYGSVSRLKVYSIEDGLPVQQYKFALEGGLADEVTVSPDSSLLLVGADESLYVYDLETGDELFSQVVPYDADYYAVYAGVISPDNQLLVASVKHLLYFYDLSTGTLIGTVANNFPGDSVNRITFSPDGRYLATASSDGTVRLWGIPNP